MQRNFRWRPGVLAAVALTLLALLPQVHLWYARGGDWQGAYASIDGDEAAYAAYLAALIEGRPRLNDPYAGVDDRAGAPLSESLFSIQFVPAYALALPARALGLGAPAVFIILTPLATFAASLALYWLLVLLLKDERLAALGVVVILCLGVFASGQGTLFALTGRRASPHFLPFLRRYVPALPFPLLFLFIALIRRALTAADGKRNPWPSALAAGAVLALLIFSYFYLWTTAAAWLACLALLWLATFGRDRERRGWEVFGMSGALALLALVPYALLLTRRAPEMDAVQALQHTRAPDLWRAPELIGYAALTLLAFGTWRGLLSRHDAVVLFAASFALTPFVVFNQQVLTGLSLQPIHYKVFTLNYVALLGFFLAAALIWQRREACVQQRTARRRIAVRAAAVLLASMAYGAALLDTVKATRLLAPTNLARDEQMRVVRRMAEIGMEDAVRAEDDGAGDASRRDGNGTGSARRNEGAGGASRRVALVTSYILSDNLPVAAPQAVLWAPHMLVNSGLTASEHKERIYQYLYYTGVAPADFPRFIDANRFLIYMLFGPARALPYLSNAHAPLTEEEINREGRAYAVYVAAFTREQAARPLLSYVVASPERTHDLSALDRWYERDAGERVGVYTIYRVRLRP
ncbi:MAG TPA: hypothetical protein VEY11_03130 [Pyrinomonadaceae bacterium]|nr:hypothetical protein [Pyrinomonadaceae bacterium]